MEKRKGRAKMGRPRKFKSPVLIAFAIDREEGDRIREFCKEKKIKISDFVRDLVRNEMKNKRV